MEFRRFLILQLNARLEELRIAFEIESVQVSIAIGHLQSHIFGKVCAPFLFGLEDITRLAAATAAPLAPLVVAIFPWKNSSCGSSRSCSKSV